nr:hypothetical protein [Desulfobacterales bacterium]
MISSVKNVKANDLNLEDNLLLGSKDMNFIKKTRYQSSRDLGEYLDFLEQIEAFHVKKKISFYEQNFEL